MNKIVQKQSLKEFLSSPNVTKSLQEVLGKNSQSFATSICQIVANNDLLKKASNISVYGAALTAATMRLPINPNLGFAYIVPYNRSVKVPGGWDKICEAQFQLGWRGFVQLAQRSGEFKSVNSTEIYENQLEEFNYLTGETKIKNEPPKGKIIGYIAHFSLLNGFQKSLYMTKDEMEKHAQKYSKSYANFIKTKKGGGVWADGEDGYNAMALKTVLKLLLSKFAPLSIEMQTAIESDQSVVDTSGEFTDYEYPDNDHELLPEEKKEKADEKREVVKKAQKKSKAPKELL